MRLTVRAIYTSTVSNLRTWTPEDEFVFFAYVIISIGIVNRRGSDEFMLVVATPKGLEEEMKNREDDVMFIDKLLVLPRYDYDVLSRWIEERVAMSTADTWEESVRRLRSWFSWEFDYDS